MNSQEGTDLPDPNFWTVLSNQEVPTVVRGKLNRWKCSKWSLEDWADKCDDISFKFRSGCKSNISQWETQNVYTQASLKDFLSWLKGKTCTLLEDHPLKRFESERSWCYSSYNYMAEVFQNSPDMLSVVDWSYLGLQDRCGYDSTLWIGSEGSNTPCHQDSYGSNLVAQLIGKKLWILYPPDSKNLLYPTRIPYEESSVFSSVNILQPDLKAFPRFGSTNPHVILLKPGDVLFVPPKWWHFVYCCDTAVSINTWVEHEQDDEWRLEEAVVRFLISALLPTYQEENSDWLNPTEEILSGNETMTLLQAAINRVKAKETSNSDTMQTANSNKNNSVLKDTEPVNQMTFAQFEEVMLSSTNYKRMDGSYQENKVVPVVNSFVSDSVVKNVIQNLSLI